jgi:hypothetical protein
MTFNGRFIGDRERERLVAAAMDRMATRPGAAIAMTIDDIVTELSWTRQRF